MSGNGGSKESAQLRGIAWNSPTWSDAEVNYSLKERNQEVANEHYDKRPASR